MSSKLSATPTLLNVTPLQAFDRFIKMGRDGGPQNADSVSLKLNILRTLLALAGSPQESDDLEATALDLFDDIQSLKQNVPVVACLLRLLPESSCEWILDAPWRTKAAAVFDASLPEIYKERRIDTKLLAHEKLEKLRQIVIEHERTFVDALSLLTSLERISAQQHRLMKAVNNKASRRIIAPFLPEEFEAEIGETFKRIEVYLTKKDEIGIVDILAATKDELNQMVAKFEGVGTHYSCLIAKQIGKRLLTLIEDDFSLNAAAQPADLRVETRDSKKYPFHLTGETINLGFVVKNHGSGYAYDAKLSLLSDDSLSLSADEILLGRLAPAASQLIEVPTQVKRTESESEIYAQTSWCNFDHSEHSSNSIITAHAQRGDVDWNKLAQSDPYSLEPVTNEEDLVGRRDIFNRLIGTLKAKSVGSAIIRGQKRVGKTSLAKTIQTNLERDGCLVIYLESGDYIEATAEATVTRLGRRLCKELAMRDPRLTHLTAPNFVDAFSPIAEFLDDVIRIIPDRRLVFILDEFDELPLDLYSRGALGDSFFLTLRSITSRSQIGFVLVGSEKVTHVMDCQGDKLNKWQVVSVDYFTKELDWADYRELVQRPVGDTLEYTERAVLALHDISAGNPYFTKLVCQRVFREAVRKRDCHITRTELAQAIETATRETERNTFQHFWEDGIFDRGGKAAEKSIRRRKILIAVSDVRLSQPAATKAKITEHPLCKNLPTVETDLKEFVTRKVLVTNLHDDTYDFKVPFFYRWLKGRGVEDVIATFSDLDAALMERQKEEELKVNSLELQKLTETWGSYKGLSITTDKVRAWLEQFGKISDQRLMFTLLKNLRFYNDVFLRNKMAEIHDLVKRKTVHRVEQKKLKRSDILVSYLDGPAKSGAHLARLYAEEASVYVDNVLEKSKLLSALSERDEIQALVFIDDFVGTGLSAAEYLKSVHTEIAGTLKERNIPVFFASVVSYVDGRRVLESLANSLDPPVHVHTCELLDESAKCFGDSSRVFSEPHQRESAKLIAQTYGKLLEKNCPLGYGGLELAVVFERGCPNNSLPILWSESLAQKWVPLFKRL